ncbi:ribonuclease J, partial [Synechococcus sp. AH-224-G16]|nr:ribonuclease J [Synechococcus sp. AH-224-G16]
GPGRDSGNGHGRRDPNAAPARVVPSRVIGSPAPAAAVAAPVAAAMPASTPAPVKEPVAATVVVTRDPEPEMPAGRTRRRRSAAA